MKTCKCGTTIPTTKVIDGKRRSLRNRTKCLSCCPFGTSKYSSRTPFIRRQDGRSKQNAYADKIKKLTGLHPANIRRKVRRSVAIIFLGGRCMACGYGRLLRNLAFHHVGGKQMELSERAFGSRTWEDLCMEIKKCLLLCHNCHGEVHADVLKNLRKATRFMADNAWRLDPVDLRQTEAIHTENILKGYAGKTMIGKIMLLDKAGLTFKMKKKKITDWRDLPVIMSY